MDVEWGNWEGAERDPRWLDDQVCDLCGFVGLCFTFLDTEGSLREALCEVCLTGALFSCEEEEMGRSNGIRAIGRSEAVNLARWYAAFAGMGESDRKMVAMIKTLINRVGNKDNAERVLRHHLSDRRRWRGQKPLEFVLAALKEYCERLGIELRDGPLREWGVPRAEPAVIETTWGLKVVM